MTEANPPVRTFWILRVVFSRQEPAIWLGHLDMMRTFERSIRRADLPVAWSQGYNPRPQLVFALPISVGLAAQADLLDIRCVEKPDPDVWTVRLNQYLPAGLRVIRSSEVEQSAKSLMSMVTEATYRIEAPEIGRLADVLLNRKQALLVEKIRKGRTSVVDLRELIRDWNSCSDDCLDIHVLAGSSRNMRPDLLLKLFVQEGGLDQTIADDAMVTRTTLILEQDGKDLDLARG